MARGYTTKASGLVHPTFHVRDQQNEAPQSNQRTRTNTQDQQMKANERLNEVSNVFFSFVLQSFTPPALKLFKSVIHCFKKTRNVLSNQWWNESLQQKVPVVRFPSKAIRIKHHNHIKARDYEHMTTMARRKKE
jgi:hypothetical protein